MSEKIYLPGLNGIRAIAALAVLFSHTNNRLDFYNMPKGVLYDLASYGVTMFFTLSGFLITFLLLKELEKTGTIDIKKFYIRRVLRIWPLYFLYLIIVVLFTGIENIKWPILFYFLMLPNFVNSFRSIINVSLGSKMTSMMVGHYWSLGVEEQFYAFWPWIVRKSKYLLKILIFFPIAFVLLKLALNLFHAPYSILVFVNYTRFGCMLLGGLGAYMFFHHREKMVFFNKKGVEIVIWLFFVVVALNKFHLTSVIDHEIISIFTLGIIFNQVNNPSKIFSLENKIFDFLGKISFGIYVYNPLVIFLLAYVINPLEIQNSLFKTMIIYVVVFSAVILISHLSYKYFEKPFLKIKMKYTTIKSAASSEEYKSED